MYQKKIKKIHFYNAAMTADYLTIIKNLIQNQPYNLEQGHSIQLAIHYHYQFNILYQIHSGQRGIEVLDYHKNLLLESFC